MNKRVHERSKTFVIWLLVLIQILGSNQKMMFYTLMRLKLLQIKQQIERLEELKLKKIYKGKIVTRMKFKYKKIRKEINRSGAV